MSSSTIEHEWELELPAETPEQILAALAARDRLFAQSITLEPDEDPGKSVEVWIGTTETIEERSFHLGIFAELKGPEEYLEAAADAIEDIVGEQVEGAATEAGQAKLVETRPAAGVEFRKVDEDQERPQLVVPEWLAPEELDVPWGFRPYVDSKLWPSEELLEAHERLIVVPFGDELRLYSLPALEEGDEDEGDSGHAHKD